MQPQFVTKPAFTVVGMLIHTKPTAAPYFERYGETFDPDDPTSKLSIYIPVEKRT